MGVIEFVSETIQAHGITDVLCIGTPSLYEHLVSKHGDISSLLLDLDVRLVGALYSK